MIAERDALGAGDDRGRAAVLLAAVAVPPALVAGVVVGLVVSGVVGLVVAVVVAAGVASGAWARAARSVPAALGGSPADPRGHARLVNVAEGLCTNAGIRLPALRVLDAAGANLAVAGRDASSAVLVVTTGLLDTCSRVELEGILAVGIVQIRRRQIAASTLAAVSGIGVAWVVRRDRDVVVDAAAARLTRYPPGLRSALQACARRGTAVPGVRRRVAHLWLADPLTDGGAPAYRRSLEERVDALSEL